MNMIKATFKITGDSSLSWSRFTGEKKADNESHDDFERRIWKKKIHTDEKGIVVIPPMAVKYSLQAAAGFLGKKVPGRGQKTFAKIFEAGIFCLTPVSLGISVDDEKAVQPNPLFLPADGKAGSGKRVMKILPLVPRWEGVAEVIIQAVDITKSVFLEHVEAAGQFVGLGQFRPARGGYFGRFTVSNLQWETL